MDYDVKYALTNWARKYFSFIVLLGITGVLISCPLIQPGDAALYLMTMNEISKV